MNANVNLHFKVRPNDNILKRSAHWNSQPIFFLSIPGLRVHFSAQRFFEHSSNEQIQKFTLFQQFFRLLPSMQRNSELSV